MHATIPSFHEMDKAKAVFGANGSGGGYVDIGEDRQTEYGVVFHAETTFFFNSIEKARLVAAAINHALADERQDLSKQIETLGADSLLPGRNRAKHAAE